MLRFVSFRFVSFGMWSGVRLGSLFRDCDGDGRTDGRGKTDRETDRDRDRGRGS